MKNLYLLGKFNLIWIITLLFLICATSLSAQQIITKHNSGNFNDNINYLPNLDEQGYTKILNQNGTQVFVKNPTSTQRTERTETARNDVSLSVNFVYDESQFYISSVLIYDELGYMHTSTYYDVTNPLVVNVPAGTYEVMTQFSPLIDSGKSHIVIKEQQSIQANTTVQMNPAAAVNHIATIGYDENGEIFQPDIGSNIFFNRWFFFNPSDLVTLQDFYFTNPEPGQNPEWNFYINDLSDRYSVIQTLIGAGFDQGNYFTKFEMISGIEGPVSITNNPADWSYHTEMFQPTQLGDEEIAKAYFFGSTFNGDLLTGWGMSSGGLVNPGDAPFRAFLNNPIDGDPANFLIIPAMMDHYVSYSPTTGGVSYFTKGNPVFSDGNGGVLYGSGDISFNSHVPPKLGAFPLLADDYYLMENNRYHLLPYHPKFSFDNATTPSVILGNNVPITVTGFNLLSEGSNTFKIENKGRYGESRESDYLATQMEIQQNGNVIFSGTLDDFGYSNLPSSGEIEIILNNPNTLVEGVAGINTTIITYNASEADAPPTLQHLQFSNSNNEVTSMLESNQGATVRLAAGDFNYTIIDEESGYYTYEDGNTVTISYSTHNQNDWTELALTEYPEFFQMTAFGNYYEASLEGIQNQYDEIWYDLKVICTDAAGNIQQQIISPAFKINNSSLAVENVTKSSFTVYPNPFSDQLNVILPENIKGNYIFRIIDLTGRTLYIKEQSEMSFSWNNTDLTKGVYILSIENNGKLITKKVIKK